ncbi:MAG TPA: PIN domain-containing protein [Nitrospiraceae bacterium]|nr:PIN domain-containing protein [Nitrospiraceae bacterium]
MKEVILLDTGPLVAFLNRADRFHDWAKAQWERVSPPMLTCEAVMTEACYLLRNFPGGSQAVIELVNRAVIQIAFKLEGEIVSVGKLLGQYADVPISLADACLVRMAEQHSKSEVLTLDRDFHIYRRHGRHVIPITTPHKI